MVLNLKFHECTVLPTIITFFYGFVIDIYSCVGDFRSLTRTLHNAPKSIPQNCGPRYSTLEPQARNVAGASWQFVYFTSGRGVPSKPTALLVCGCRVTSAAQAFSSVFGMRAATGFPDFFTKSRQQHAKSSPISHLSIATRRLLLGRLCIRVVDNSEYKQLGPTDRLRIRRV